MGRLYAVTFNAVTLDTGGQDWYEIQPANDKPCLIRHLELTQRTEVGDAQEEMITVLIRRGHTTSGTGGTATTPEPLDGNDAAAGAVVEVGNITTGASLGATDDLYQEAFNLRTGFEMWWDRWPPRVSQADTTLVARMVFTPNDAITFVGTLIFEELG